MSKIKQNLKNIQKNIKIAQSKLSKSNPITIIGVTKYASIDQMKALISAGITNLGESKIQVLEEKKKIFTNPKISWHFIGHLQTNKVKKAIILADLIQSVDSIKLLEKINYESAKLNKIMPILLQVNIASEESKYGFSSDEFLDLLPSLSIYKNIQVRGLMSMAPFIQDEKILLDFFSKAYHLYKVLQSSYNKIEILSMGMSNDYQYAIQNGANMIRIGSAFFA